MVVRLLYAHAAAQEVGQLAVDVNPVVDAHPDAQRDDGQGGDLHTDSQPGHQGLGQEGCQRQRHHDAYDGPPGGETEKHQRAHDAVDQHHHARLRGGDFLVGGGLDAGVAGRQREMYALLPVACGEFLCGVDHPLQGFGLVVAKVEHHR